MYGREKFVAVSGRKMFVKVLKMLHVAVENYSLKSLLKLIETRPLPSNMLVFISFFLLKICRAWFLKGLKQKKVVIKKIYYMEISMK
jgi:hypothetical protein